MCDRKKSDTIPLSIRNGVWCRYVSDALLRGMCYCCKVTQITVNDFQCGYYVSKKNGGETTVDNLRPLCSSCNTSLGIKNMDEFMKTRNADIVHKV